MQAIKTVGLLGLGKMGRPMARLMMARGFDVVGYDPVIGACDEAASLGVSVVESPAEVAARCELVIVVVGFESQVEKVLFQEKGILEGAKAGLIVAVASTVSPSYSRELAARLKERQIDLLDIPLTRGEPAAEAGKLLILGAGGKEIFEHCKQAFDCFASDIFYLGLAGAGQTGKMVNNLIMWACMAANDEGLRLGAALGVDPEQLRAALIHSSAQNWVLSTRAEEKPISWAEKDMTIVLAEADKARLSLPLCGTLKEVIKGLKIRLGLGMPIES